MDGLASDTELETAKRATRRKERAKCVEIALVFNQIRTKQLELLRMDSRDSEKTGTTADSTLGPTFSTSPLDPSNDSIPLPRSSHRLPVPLSPLELLPTEIHIEIVQRVAEPTKGTLDYAQLCKLARVSPIFTKLAQAQLYHHLVLFNENSAREWLESAATIRREFATRKLVLGGADEGEECVSATTCEEVLALQTSDLKDLTLFRAKGVRSSSFNKLSGLRTLSFIYSILVDDGSEIVIPFRLRQVCVYGSSLPSHHLLAIVESSTASITKLDLEFWRGFDWSPLTSLPSPAFCQLAELRLVGSDIPPLAFLSRCGSLKKLVLYRYNSILTRPLMQLREELASLPNPTLVKCDIDLRYVLWDGGIVTLRELETLIEIPSLANLERLQLVLPPDMDLADVEILRGIKGKEGKLVVEVEFYG